MMPLPDDQARAILAAHLEKTTTEAEIDVIEFGAALAILIGVEQAPARYIASDVIAFLRYGVPSIPTKAANGLSLQIDLEK